MYLLVRNSTNNPQQTGASEDGGMTASEVATATGLHANVARHHLDKLVSGGYLKVTQRASGGAGRPAKVYCSTNADLAIGFNVGHDDILVTLLGRALNKLPEEDATALAEEVGREFGQRMADSMGSQQDAPRSFRSALQAVADALSAHGFAAHTEDEGNELRIVSDNCPFGAVVVDHPVICAIDRGMVKGMLGSLYGETTVDLSDSIALGASACVTSVRNSTI